MKRKQRQVVINVPLYEYKCDNCDKLFEVFIGMNDTQDCCIFCDSKDINKIVSMIGAKANEDDFKIKKGDVVKKHIKDAREGLKQEKKNLKKKVYK